MRPTCTFCARKHLSQASILAAEAAMGYPDHIWLAIGHLAEASDELIGTFPAMANEIREHRKALELRPDAAVPFMELIAKVGKLDHPNTYPVASPVNPLAQHPVSTLPTGLVSTRPAESAVWRSHGTTSAPDDEPHGLVPITIDDKTASTAPGLPVQPTLWPSTPMHVGGSVAAPTPPQLAFPTSAMPPRPDPEAITRTHDEHVAALNAEAARLPPKDHPDHAKAVQEFQTKALALAMARRDAGVPAPVDPNAPLPCLTCADKAQLTAVTTALAAEVARPRLIILTTLADFSPGYSLTSVVLEQAHAAVLAGYRVFVLVHRGCSLAKCPPLPAEISMLSIVPLGRWRDDVINEEDVSTFVGAINEWVAALVPNQGPLHIITHDLLFQAAFVSFAKAIHIYSGRIYGDKVRWYHMAHSSVGPSPRSLGVVDRGTAIYYRCTLPPGHRLLALNYADVPYLQRYYDIAPDRIHTLLNSKDVRPFLRMSMTASMLTTRYQLHRADVTMLFPVSIDRVKEKGIDKVLQLLGAMKKLSLQVRIVIATAHANDAHRVPPLIAWIREHATANGLGADDVILTCEALPDTAAAGLSADDIRALWLVSNLFIFPTTSEAGSLVLMEAASAGCHMVLNASLPCLADYVPREWAQWVPWGSVKQPGNPPAGEAITDLAESIWARMQDDTGMTLRRRMMVRHSLEAYGLELRQILEPAPVSVEDDPSVHEDESQHGPFLGGPSA